MKIEMGENLVYSWLRHVQDCQIVQTNWKTSPQWTLQHEADLKILMQAIDVHFKSKYGYEVFKNNKSLDQLLRQGECDVMGVSFQGNSKFFAVDVAFHENGLNYGKTHETVMKVVAKTARTAMSMWGYLDNTDAEIIFASPKIGNAVLKKLQPCIDDINDIFKMHHLDFKARLIGNEDFTTTILEPMLLLSDKIADTSELFLRSHQLTQLLLKESASKKKVKTKATAIATVSDPYVDYKIGKLATIILRGLLEAGKVTDSEIDKMQTVDYSKEIFDLQYPVLVKESAVFDKARYYASPLTVKGQKYYLCSQWFEKDANNDRPYLLKWIEEHK